MAGKLSIVFLDASTFGDVSLKRFSENWNCAVHKVTAPAEVAERLRGRDVVILNKVVLDGALL
ncbi:MAG: hydroxyacid dehydrogenase, partial [Deltaproteobacteria bacterium]|nr:hydroxyacid dehydrogenase [Deltaproteobacteria bacterium]